MSVDAHDPDSREEKEREPLDERGGVATDEGDGEDDQVLTINADAGAAKEGEFADEDDDSRENERQEKSLEQERSMRRPTNAREVLTQFVPNRSERADDKLRSHLVGKIAISIEGPNEAYLFEWQSGRASVREESAPSAECAIKVSEANLMRVVAGELNPQVAMLSGKIQVEGNAEAAIYFFNLVAPRSHQ